MKREGRRKTVESRKQNRDGETYEDEGSGEQTATGRIPTENE